MKEPYDWDFRRLMDIDDEEHRAALGEHIMGMINDANEGKEDPAGSIFDAVGRAKVAKEGEAGLGPGDDAA